MLPEARLTHAGARPDGTNFVRALSVSDFIAAASPLLSKKGFFERGLVSRIDRFGNIAQIFSSYESRHAPDEKPFTRGINSIQFLFYGHRWWVLSILWDEERSGLKLPDSLQIVP